MQYNKRAKELKELDPGDTVTLRRTREVTPRGRDEIGPPPREEPTPATANASGELLSVPPTTRSTAVRKVQLETTPLQETDKP